MAVEYGDDENGRRYVIINGQKIFVDTRRGNERSKFAGC